MPFRLPRRFPPFLCLVLALGLLPLHGLRAGPFSGGPTLDDPLVHRSTKFAFPAKIGPFARALPQQYDADGEDFSIAYDSFLPPASVTVFVYPAAGRTLEDELTRRQHEITILHPDAKLLSRRGATAALTPAKTRAFAATYRYRAVYGEDEQPVLSDLLLALHGDRFVAYRIVYPATARSISEPAIRQFEQNFPWP